MKRFLDIFLSSKATFILLILIGLAMASATFIEDKYDTVTARVLVYDTRWFEFLFLLLIINLIGHIQAYKLLSWKRLGGLMFHLAFVVMILGAGVTRYFGFEGSMHIRKGETEDLQKKLNDKSGKIVNENLLNTTTNIIKRHFPCFAFAFSFGPPWKKLPVHIKLAKRLTCV